MKTKRLWPGLGLCLLAVTVQAEGPPERFLGGSYDGWDLHAMAAYKSVDPLSVRFLGGSYDGWDLDTMAAYKSVAPAAKLAFTSQPGGGTEGAVWLEQPVVTVQDAAGYTVLTDTSTVTLSIETDPPGGSTLSGTTSQAAVAGVATFSGLRIDQAGVGFKLLAAVAGLTSATSEVFTVVAAVGPPDHLAFLTQPEGGTNHEAWPQQPQVVMQDAANVVVTGVATNITLAIANNPADGTLGGTVTVAVDTGTGVATFSGLSIDKVGAGYTLAASTAGGLTSPASDAFDIVVGPEAQLAFTTQPGDGLSYEPWATQPAVTLQDAYGNTVTGTAQTVTLAIQNNAGPGGTLSGTLTVAVNTGTGVATFGGLSIDKVGTDYTLTAYGSTVNTTPGVMVSAAFEILENPPLNRFLGGSYDGWDLDTMAAYKSVAPRSATVFQFR